MDSVNVFYAPELENPPMDSECSINFSTIVHQDTTSVRIRGGINKVDSDKWDGIKGQPYAQRLLKIGALRVMEETEVKEVLTDEELNVPEDVKLTDLSIPDATQVIGATHDLQRLGAWLEEEKRVPVRKGLQRRIDTLSGGD